MLRRPVVSAVAATGLLLVLAAPAIHMKTANMSSSDIPQNLPVMKTFNRIDKAFPGKNNEAVVVVKSDNVRNGQTTQAIADLKRKALATGQMHNTITTEYSKDGTVAQVSIPMDGDGNDNASKSALAKLRGEVIPATVGGLAHTSVNVTGATAQTVDSQDQLSSAMPIVFGFVLILAFGLLLVTFRVDRGPDQGDRAQPAVGRRRLRRPDLRVPAGSLRGPARLPLERRRRHLAATVPVRGAVRPLDGLPRVHPQPGPRGSRRRHEAPMTRSRYGIKSTAGVVTSAAFVMVAVFSIFATLQVIDFKELGVGLAVAVLLDATIVRAVLLPATMKLLGERNWYLPSWLQWLPQVKVEGSPDETKPAKRAASSERQARG